MKPTYVEFDALRNELATLRLQLALAKDALKEVVSWSMCGTQAGRIAEDALAAIDDSKLLDGYVLCDALPVAWLHSQRFESDVITDKVKHLWGRVKQALGREAQYTIPLYARRKV